MRKLEVKIRQIIWALNKIIKPTTYDIVLFNGNKYFIKSSLTGDNIWNLYKMGVDKPIYMHIRGNEFKIIHSLDRFVKCFKNHMKFQVQSWQQIDERKPIGTRLSYYNSDNIRF